MGVLQIEIWPETAERDEATSWDESLGVGDEADSAAVLITLLFGNPCKTLIHSYTLTATATRASSVTAVVKRSGE